MKAPCQDCPERELGCHDKCERYQEFRKYREEINRKRAEQAKARNIVIDQIMRQKGNK